MALSIEERLERLEAETIPPNSLSLRHRVQALEHPRPSLGDLRSLETRLNELPPIPENLCERVENLEATKVRLSDEGAELRTRMNEAERTGHWVSKRLTELETSFSALPEDLRRRLESVERKCGAMRADVEEIADNLRTRLESLERTETDSQTEQRIEIALAPFEAKIRDLLAFRGRVDSDLVALTRRIVTVERLGAPVARLNDRVDELEGLRIRIDEDLVELRGELRGLYIVPEIEVTDGPPASLEEKLRNEAAELRGRAGAVGEDGEAPFDGAAAEALCRVGSIVGTAALAIIEAVRRPPPVRVHGEIPEKIEVSILGRESR